MNIQRLFENEQELERIFILYGNTTDCYFNGKGQPYMSFEALLESHLDSLKFKRVIFYSGKETLRCYSQAHAGMLDALVDPPRERENAAERTPGTDRVHIRTSSRFMAKGRSQEEASGKKQGSYTKSTKEEGIPRLLDAAMRDHTVKTCVVFTHCWSMLDMQTNADLKEQMADAISGWYSLSANNHNIAIFIFSEPRLESLAGFLRNKSAWAFLYERMFCNDLPTDTVIRIGGPQRDEIYHQMSLYIGPGMYSSEVEKAAMTLVQQQGGKLLALRRYLGHLSVKLGVDPAKPLLNRSQREALIADLLKEYGDSEAADPIQVINETEGWEEIGEMITRMIAEAGPPKEEKIDDIVGNLDMSCLRMTVRTPQPSSGVNMTIMLKGNPGTGKTTAANWIGRAFRKAGLLPVGRVIVATKDQLEAGYVGQSAIKTREKINEAIGNVLFIDEAYSLFRSEDEGRASFGREVIDTLVEAMSAHRGEMAFILAGYPKEMDHFLTSNSGLRRRFGDNIVTIRDYDAGVLERIALKDLERDSGDGAAETKTKSIPKRTYLLAPELIYSDSERQENPEAKPMKPEDALRKTRDDRKNDRELCPFSVYFDNWFADRDRVTFGNAGAALQLADGLRTSASRRAEREGVSPNAPLLITRADFPEDTEYLFECRKPSASEIDRQMEDVIGMEQVKTVLRRIRAYMQLSILQGTMRGDKNARRVEPGHYLFVGNPGTGKTMIAEKLALTLSGLGVIQRYQPVRVTGLELANMLTNQRGMDKLKEFIDSCVGGVLVIDEAHQLAETNLGPIALKALLDPMIRKKEEMSVVFCCYPEKEKAFLEIEPGLARRISDIIRFEDYKPEDIRKILRLKAKKEEYTLTDAVDAAVLGGIETLLKIENQNGGTAEKLFKAMKIALGGRLMEKYTSVRALKEAAQSDPGLLHRFEPLDVEKALRILTGGDLSAPEKEIAAPGYAGPDRGEADHV